MRSVVVASDDLWDEFSTTLNSINCVRVNDRSEFDHFNSEDVFFDLLEDAASHTHTKSDALYFINSSIATLHDSNQHQNVIRLNCWRGFLGRSKWEIAGSVHSKVSQYLATINKEYVVTPDVPGFISSRILSMIINEAYFALNEGVSTKQEIDTAMKLGTNYPKGPFEWSQEIGLNNVVRLLNKMSEEDVRYKPAPLLQTESTKA